MALTETEIPITWESVSLTIAGIIWVADPPGSFDVHSDDRLALYDALAKAMAEHGVGDKTDLVFETLSNLAKPHFAGAVTEFEQIRLKVIGDNPDR